jgi:hypothetical protein
VLGVVGPLSRWVEVVDVVPREAAVDRGYDPRSRWGWEWVPDCCNGARFLELPTTATIITSITGRGMRSVPLSIRTLSTLLATRAGVALLGIVLLRLLVHFCNVIVCVCVYVCVCVCVVRQKL